MSTNSQDSIQGYHKKLHIQIIESTIQGVNLDDKIRLEKKYFKESSYTFMVHIPKKNSTKL